MEKKKDYFQQVGPGLRKSEKWFTEEDFFP